MTGERCRVLVLSDTHVRDDGHPALPPEVFELARRADAIVHAGDVVSSRLLDDLASLAPTIAVLGNNDHGLEGRLPVRREVELGGVRIGMVHDSGARHGRPARLRRWFPTTAVVVFGHSHEPVLETGLDGQLLLNPGSPTQRRRQPACTLAVLDVGHGQVEEVEIRTLTS